ncbi:MAG: hypothetical protein H7325_01135 [Pedobacter sp.]|nr:hypothetical protein [Pedobacter sp.]
MKKYFFLLILTFSNQVFASNFFKNCDAVLDKPEFQKLNQFFSTNDKFNKTDNPLPPDMCFRLNNNYFLFTVVDTGNLSQGLYFYNAKTDTFGQDEGKYSPNIGVEKEFLGAHNKRFVLLSSGMLRHGDSYNWFTILNLTPTKTGKPYIHYNLIDSVQNGGSGMCGDEPHDRSKNDNNSLYIYMEIASYIHSYKVSNEGRDAVNIVFDVDEQNCKTMAHKNIKKTYCLKNDRFVEK